jgi:hypothetical protein
VAASIGIITNLKSRRNRAGTGRVERLSASLGGDVMVRATSSLGEIRGVVEEFIDAGCGYWVADGGDGTLNCLVNEGASALEDRGLWDRRSPFPYFLVPANGGTIDFVARKAGIRSSSSRIIRTLVDGVRSGRAFTTADLPTLEVVGHRVGDPEGSMGFRRLGFATAVGGIGQKFFEKYYEAANPNPWTIIQIAVKVGTGHLMSFVPYHGFPWMERWKDHSRDMMSGTRAHVVADGRVLPYDSYQGLHVGSVDVDFGTMKLFPFAGLPGKLHLVAGALTPSEASWKWIWLVAGRPIPGGTWHEFPGESLEVRARDGEVLDPVIDGETFSGLDHLIVRPGPVVRVPLVK